VSVKCGTFDADVSRLEVRFEVVWTRLGGGQQCVRDPDGALAPRRAASVHQADDVRGAAHVTIVVAHAPAEPHPAVLRMRHQDGGAELATGVESFSFTVDAAVLCACQTPSAVCLSTMPSYKPPDCMAAWHEPLHDRYLHTCILCRVGVRVSISVSINLEL